MTEPTNTLPEPYQSGMLKPCPFCGHEAKKMIGPEEWIECSVCHACTAMHSDIKYAILDWNRRVKE